MACFKKIAALSAVAALALAGFMALSADAVSAAPPKGPDPYAKFKKDFTSSVSRIRHAAADTLSASDTSVYAQYATVLADPYWQVRVPVLSRIAQMSADARPAFVEFMESYRKGKQPEPGLREKVYINMLWAYSRGNLSTPEAWAPLRNAMSGDDVGFAARARAAREMWRWPSEQPVVISDNATDEGRKEQEAKNKAINDVAQPILKANFQAYLDLLKKMDTDAKLKKAVADGGKDTMARQLKWNVIYGLELYSSQEYGDSYDSWEIFWTKIQADSAPLKYKFEGEREGIQIAEGEKVQGRTSERVKKKKETSTHLMVMPQIGYPDDYFNPYISEFTQYFKLSTYPMPSGAAYGRPYVPDPRDKNPPAQGAYFYPTEKMGELFKAFREKQGGTIGMLCHGEAADIAMQYAKADPKGCAFIICVGGWSGYDSLRKARTKAEDAKSEKATRWYFKSLYFPAPNPPLDEDQKFDAETGSISYQFADLWNPDQYTVNRDLDVHRRKGSDTGGKQMLIDDKYQFKSDPISVPTLFIWGDKDPVYSADAQKDIERYFTNSMIVRMPNVSRQPWLEDPIAFFDVFSEFMNKRGVWKAIEKAKAKEEKESGKSGGDK